MTSTAADQRRPALVSSAWVHMRTVAAMGRIVHSGERFATFRETRHVRSRNRVMGSDEQP